MKKMFLILAITIPTFLFAQKTGNLTVFSDDGDKFFLVLNGEKQNDIPQTNIRVEELPQPYYSAKIIFVDSALSPISKQLQIVDLDNKMMDVTYRIRKDKAGKVKLNPYSSIEVQPDFVAPEGMYVHQYGRKGGRGGFTQTTTTTTSNSTVDASISVPGISMNVSINDPEDRMSTTTTTTTTTTRSSSSHSSSVDVDSRDDDKCRWAMKQTDFAAAKKTISETTFEDTRLSTAKSIVTANCVSSDQVVAICNLFTFEDSKLAFAKFAYKYTTDPKNYFKVSNVFTFDTSKEELSKFTSGE